MISWVVQFSSQDLQLSCTKNTRVKNNWRTCESLFSLWSLWVWSAMTAGALQQQTHQCCELAMTRESWDAKQGVPKVNYVQSGKDTIFSMTSGARKIKIRSFVQGKSDQHILVQTTKCLQWLSSVSLLQIWNLAHPRWGVDLLCSGLFSQGPKDGFATYFALKLVVLPNVQFQNELEIPDTASYFCQLRGKSVPCSPLCLTQDEHPGWLPSRNMKVEGQVAIPVFSGQEGKSKIYGNIPKKKHGLISQYNAKTYTHQNLSLPNFRRIILPAKSWKWASWCWSIYAAKKQQSRGPFLCHVLGAGKKAPESLPWWDFTSKPCWLLNVNTRRKDNLSQPECSRHCMYECSKVPQLKCGQTSHLTAFTKMFRVPTDQENFDFVQSENQHQSGRKGSNPGKNILNRQMWTKSSVTNASSCH